MKVHARVLFDGTQFLRNALVDVQGSMISAVECDVARPVGSDAILMAESVSPGLIDAHTHLIWDATFDAIDRVEREGNARTLDRAAEHARQHLRAGVTTVRDLGSTARLSVALAAAIDGGSIAGPRVVAAGLALGSPGGHASAMTREVTGAAEASRAAQEEIEAGARVLKLIASGGLHDPGDQPHLLAMDPDAIVAAVKVARASGIPIAAHAHHPDVIRFLVEAGVSSIEHGALIDRATAQLMARHGTVLVPTLTIFDAVATMHGLDDATRSRYEGISARAQAACRIAAGEGVTIVAGTDGGGPETPHGSVVREMALLAAAGVDKVAALSAGTAAAADLLGVGDRAGRISVGMPADLVAFEHDPGADLQGMSRLWVMHRGEIVSTEG
jgi:imidazolonepropionase-like amidohydrolase